MFLKDLLGRHRLVVRLPTEWATAATVDDVCAFIAPFGLEVTSVKYLPDVDLTGVTATEATLEVLNKGLAGAGTAVMATHSFIDASDAAEFVALALTLGAAADIVAVEGDVITIEKSVTSTGLAIAGSIEIEFRSIGP